MHVNCLSAGDAEFVIFPGETLRKRNIAYGTLLCKRSYTRRSFMQLLLFRQGSEPSEWLIYLRHYVVLSFNFQGFCVSPNKNQ